MQISVVQEKILDLLVFYIAKDSQQNISIKGKKGWFPWNFTLSSLTIADQKGTWLCVNDLQCELSYKNLLTPFHLVINDMNIMRAPTAHVHQIAMEEKSKIIFTPPAIKPEIWFKQMKWVINMVDRVEIKNLHIHPTITPLVSHGQIFITNKDKQLDITLKTNSNILQTDNQGKLAILPETIDLHFESNLKGSAIADYGIIHKGIKSYFNLQLRKNSLNVSTQIKQLDCKNFKEFIGDKVALQAQIKTDKNCWQVDNLSIQAKQSLTGKLQSADGKKLEGQITLDIPELEALGLSRHHFARSGKIQANIVGSVDNPQCHITFDSPKVPWQKFFIDLSLSKENYLYFYLYCNATKDNLFKAEGFLKSNFFNCGLDINLHDIRTLGSWLNTNSKGQLLGKVKIADWDISKIFDFSGNFNCDLQSKGLEFQNFTAEKILLNINLQNGEGKFEGILKKGKIFNKDFSGEILGSIDKKEQFITCKNLSINVGKYFIKLNKPTTFKNDIALLELKLNDGGLILVENLAQKPWRGKISIKSLPLSILQLLWDEVAFSGKLNGIVNLYGEKSYPSVKGVIAGEGLSASGVDSNHDLIKHLNAKLEFDWSMSKLLWQLSFFDNEYINFISKGEFADKNINGQIKGGMKLKLIGNLCNSNDRIYGDLQTDLKITGSINSPQLQGYVTVKNGLYENADSGTIFKNITLDAKAKGSHIEIYQILGQDNQHHDSNNSGWVRGSGNINLSNLYEPKIEIKLRLNDTQIAGSEAFKGKATGEVSLLGPIDDIKIQGDVELFPAELLLEEVSDKKIPKLKIINKVKKNKKKKQKSNLLPMNIAVKVPSKLFIRGFGVDSQWKGNIRIVDSLLNPQMLGQITIVKGNIDFLGKSLQIIHGTIIYDEIDFNEPLLDIVASKEAPTKEVLYLKITGRGNDPKIEFSSSPALPQEEVLAMILFGKKLNQISAMQSIQLFSAIASLRGHNGLNFLEKIRSTFGLDSVEVKESRQPLQEYDDNNGQTAQAISLGKEFGKVRVAVEQGTGASSSKITVSTPLTTINDVDINADADVGSDRNSGIGLSCQKRY